VTQQFIPADELKQRYGVFGHFYSVELAAKEIVECRSVLELAAKSRFHDARSRRGHEEHRAQGHGRGLKEYLTRLMKEQGLIGEGDTPSDEELRRFDKQRTDKKVSNEEWVSPTDPDARIAKMKDGTTHLAYKAEPVVDLDSNLILGAEIYHANQADTQTLEDSVQQAQTNLREAGSAAQIEDVVADKGYHSNETLGELSQHTPCRTYIPEPQSKHQRTWTDKPPEQKAAAYATRRRTRGQRGRKLQRLRSERVERTFAHVCETGGARRTWPHGINKLRKRYSIAAAHNLGCLMCALFQMGTPRGLQAFADLLSFAQIVVQSFCRRFQLQLRQLPTTYAFQLLAA
jgi:transposase